MESFAGKLERIAQRYHVRDIYVFGSRAAEIARRVASGTLVEPQSASDVDVAVQPTREQSLDAAHRVRLMIELEDLFGAARVDLVVLSEASPFLAVDVIRGELLYTADPRAQAEHELYILRRAGDLASFQMDRVHQILTDGGR